jgi:hypothetical protein
MKIRVSIDCSGAAFDDDAGPELARILRDVARKLDDGADPRNEKPKGRK